MDTVKNIFLLSPLLMTSTNAYQKWKKANRPSICFLKRLMLCYLPVLWFFGIIPYSSINTVQLSVKVTFTRVPDASCTHFRCVSHTLQMPPKCVLVRLAKKGSGTYVRTSRCSYIDEIPQACSMTLEASVQFQTHTSWLVGQYNFIYFLQHRC